MFLSDTPKVDLQDHRDCVQNCFDELSSILQHLQNIKTVVVIEAAKFEELELQHQDLMQRVSLHIHALEN